MRSLVLVPLLFYLGVGCDPPRNQPAPIAPSDEPAKPAPTAISTPAPMPTPTPISTEPTTPGKAPDGFWVSRQCGPRNYRRTLHFEGTRFEAVDVPHPCPAECVVQWVVSRKGSFSTGGADFALTVESTDDPQHQAGDTTPLPSRISIDHGAPAERLADGTVCRYTR